MVDPDIDYLSSEPMIIVDGAPVICVHVVQMKDAAETGFRQRYLSFISRLVKRDVHAESVFRQNSLQDSRIIQEAVTGVVLVRWSSAYKACLLSSRVVSVR